MDSIVLLQPNHQHKHLLISSNLMNPLFLSSKFKLNPKTLFSKSLQFRCFCTNTTTTTTSQQQLQDPIEVIQAPLRKPTENNGTNSKTNIQNLNESWLTSLTNGNENGGIEGNDGVKWVIGVDPDVSGALALLKFDHSGCIFSQVFDSPYVQVSVGKTRRKRLDAKSIVEMLQSFDAPIGTTAYLEQSIPFPQDGKLGWWSGGFGYGLWIGVLVASGFSVVPVPSSVWKKEFELARSSSSKDDSRELAARLFPDLSSMLKRKKDHGINQVFQLLFLGRAEALLIAAYGKGLKTKVDEPCVSDDCLEVLAKS